jgi:hypothetical protein
MGNQCRHELHLIELKLDAILALLKAIYTGKATDLAINFKKGTETMSNVNVPCLSEKSKSKPRAVMPDVTLTSPLPTSMTLQPLNAAGAAIVLTPADVVTGTLASDNVALTISAGADSTHYTGTIPANTPQGSVANLAATLKGTIQSAPADLTASVKVTIDVPPSPVATDLAIIFG